jgi:hypothetical protein
MRNLTKWFILASLVLIIGYDIFAVLKDGEQATISAVLLGWSREYPPLTLAFGVLMGHLFWPQKVVK